MGPHTVNTMPPATLAAFRDHGESRDTLRGTAEDAAATLVTLASLGIAMPEVTAQLLAEGLASFEKSFVTLLGGLDRKVAALGAPRGSEMQGTH